MRVVCYSWPWHGPRRSFLSQEFQAGGCETGEMIYLGGVYSGAGEVSSAVFLMEFLEAL